MTQRSSVGTPSSDSGAEYLPISLQFRHRPDLGRIQGSVMNNSGSELVIDATIYDPNTRESAKVQLDVAPYTAKPFGVDDGLDMQSGDRITLQSTPYRDRVAQIP